MVWSIEKQLPVVFCLTEIFQKTACLGSHGFHPETRNQWAELCALFDEPAVEVSSYFALTSPIRSNMNFEEYAQAFHELQSLII